MVEQTPFNLVRAQRQGKLKGINPSLHKAFTFRRSGRAQWTLRSPPDSRITAFVLRPVLRPALLEKWTFDKRESVVNARLKRTLVRRVNALLPPRPLGDGWGEGSPQAAQSAKQGHAAEKSRAIFAHQIGLHCSTYGRDKLFI